MKKLIAFGILFLTPCLVQAQQLRIDLVVLATDGSSTQLVNSINYSHAQTTNIQAAVDAKQTEGNSVTRLRKQMMKRIKELCKDHVQDEGVSAAQQAKQNLINNYTELPEE